MKNRWAVFAVVGFEMAASVAVGMFAGDWLDEKFANKTPYMTVAGVVIGTVCGFVLLFRTLAAAGGDEGDEV